MKTLLRANGRVVIVALDHGLIDGPISGLVDPIQAIRGVEAGGADAVIVSYGAARHFREELQSLTTIVRLDGSLPREGPTGSLFFSPQQVQEVGADAVAVSAFPLSAYAASTLGALSAAIAEARQVDMPVLAEMVPGGFDGPPTLRTAENMALAARVGAELGADLIKTPYCEEFERVTQSTFVPVVILGGSRKKAELETLTEVFSSIQAGGAGVAIGRNVFQSTDPAAMTAAIVAIVHENASVQEAATLLPSD